MITNTWGQSLSPGNEQAYYWSSRAARTPGSRNYAGIANTAVDELVDLIANARSRQALITATRALDRVLMTGHHVMPLYHSKVDRIAYWSHLQRPETVPLYGFQLDSWWSQPPVNAR